MNGILNVYKPPGASSAQIVGKVKHILKTRAVGHMGTLDPMGEGVLLMGVGKGTRLFDYFLSKTKTYEATFRFGLMTDTIDVTGEVTGETTVLPTVQEINAILPSFIGEQAQLPPLYSAKSVGGVRAYKLARMGQTVELKPAIITINSLELIGTITENEYLFRIDCSAGTYIRSICRDIAEKLGSLAIMTSIKRTRCGRYFSDTATVLDEVSPEKIIPLQTAIQSMPKVYAPDNLYKKIINGVPVLLENCPNEKFALFCREELIGIAEYTEKGCKIKTYLKEDNNA